MNSQEADYIRDIKRQAGNRGEIPYIARAGQVIGMYQGLPELRGFWPFSSVDENGSIVDLSSQGRTLGNNTVVRGALASGLPFGGFDGASSYLGRSDEAGLDITGALTIGGWFALTSIASGKGLIGKYGVSASSGGYMLYMSGVGTPAMVCESAAGAVTTVSSSVTFAQSTWVFLAGRFNPSTEQAVCINTTWTKQAAGIAASLRNNAIDFRVGAFGSPIGGYMSGYSSLCFLCATTLSDSLLASIYNNTRGLFGV